MATIVNARDSLLQATQARVANVSISSNLIVNQNQVDGLGLVVAGTKMVFLTATTQVFQVAKTGTVSPTSTTLRADVKNLTASPSLSVVSGTVDPVPVFSNGMVSVDHTHLKTDSATLRLTVTQDDKTYTDEITLVKVREGIDALSGYLTNESHTIPADHLGNITNYNGATGTFKVFHGTADVTSLCTFSTVDNPSNLTNAGSSAIIVPTTGVYTVTGGYPQTGTEVTTVTVRATFGTSTLDKVFTLSKTKLAIPAKTLYLSASSQVFQVPKDGGTVSPSSITLTAQQNGLAGSPTFTPVTTGVTVTHTAGQSTATVTYAGMGANDTAIIKATWDGLEDTITLAKVREGTDAIISLLTNESHAIPTEPDGTPVTGAFDGATTTMKVFKGINDDSANWVFSTGASPQNGVSFTFSGATLTVTGLSADTGFVDITATRSGYATQTKRFTLNKTRKGNTGTTGIRGSRSFYVTLSETTATWSDATATSAASVDGGPVKNDTVTQSNSSQGFSQTRFWDGSAWLIVNAVVDGNLLVSGTVSAGAMVTGLMNADNVLTRGLTVRDNAGNIILSADTKLDGRTYIRDIDANSITAGSIRGISVHAATMGTLGTYLTVAIPKNADGTWKKYHEKLDVTTTQDFWQPVKGCTYDRPIDSTVMTVTCPVAHGLELDQRIKTLSLTTTSNAVDVDDYVRTIPNATTFTLSVAFNTHLQYSGTCDVMGLGAILGARPGSISGTHTPFWYKDKTAITLVDIYPTDSGELPDSPVKTSVVPFHKLSMSFDAAHNAIYLIGPREKGRFNVPFALNQNDAFLCTLYAPPTKGALNVTSNQGGNTARFDNGAVTQSAARAIYATANSDGVGVHAIGRKGGFFETHFGGTGIGVEGYSYAGSGVLGRGRKIGVEGHSTNLETGAYDFYASGAALNYGPFTGSHDGLMLKNSTWTEGDIIVDDLIVHRKNISNTIAQNSLSSKPMQKGVIGVLACVNPLTRESPPSALVVGYNEVVTLQPAPDNPDEEQVKDTKYVPILVDNYDDLATKYDRISFNAVGEGQINVCKEGGNLEVGDLICASSTAGKGMKQSDDVVRGCTVAKVREAVTWASTESDVRKVACIYLCG